MSNIYGVCYTTKEPVVYNRGTQWEKTCSDFLFVQANKDNGTKLVDKLNTQKGITIDYRVMPGAGHVYTPDQTEKVVDAAEDHVMGVLNRGRMALAAD